MSEIYLLQLAAQRAHWLSARETLVAANIANANTTGYRALDVQPFSEVLDKTNITLVTTNAAHITPGVDDDVTTLATKTEGQDVSVSGNSVSIEQELTKAGDINRSFTLNTNITRIFHQMFLTSVK